MKILTAENKYIQLFINYSLPLFVIGVISRTFPITSSFYFIVPVLLIINIMLAIFLLPRTRKYLTYIAVILLFPAYCLITSTWSLNPVISFQRSIYLLLLYAGIFSSILFYKISFFDKGLGFLIPANILVIVLSAISLIFSIPVYSWTGGNGLGFMGFAGHQNTLAVAILFTLPGVVALGREQRAKYQSSGVFLRLWRISAFILLLASNLLLLALSYSRAAIFALVVGIFSYLIITRSKKILLLSFVIIAITMVLYSTIPFLQSSINSALNKNSNRFMDRRTVLWQPSLEAAKQGGIFGLGYGISAPAIKTHIKTGSHYDDGRYIREKGNSVLAMIEETGVIGLLLFLLPMTLLFRNFSLLTTNYRLLTAALAALLLHAQFEAWWVGVGSISLPLFLIFLFFALLSEKSLTINQI